MPYRDEASDLDVQIHCENYELPASERELIDDHFLSLIEVVSDFPVAALHLHIRRHPRQGDFHVKANLRLPKKNLFTGERNRLLIPACESCARKLLRKVKAFKEKLSRKPEYSKAAEGTSHELFPEREPDARRLLDAARQRDYPAFRDLMGIYDDALFQRVGRWVVRYPDLAARVGEDGVLDDLVEAVYREAFEEFPRRPSDRLGNWLEGLIDPCARRLLGSRPSPGGD